MLAAGLIFLAVVMVMWTLAVIIGVGLRFRHLLRRPDDQPNK